MRISKVGQNFGTSLRRHTQPLTSPIIQSSPTRTRGLYRQWKILSLWGEGSFVASIANRTLSRNVVVEMVKERCPLFGCTITSLVASQLQHFQPQEKSTRIRCSPQTTTTSSTSLRKMQFPATRCAQGDSVFMYGKSASSGVEAMNRANEEIHQKTAADILNATVILLKKESAQYNKQQNLA
jgi:hypothetical protein